MEEQHRKDPAFLKDVYELTEGMELFEALNLSLNKIDEIDIDQLKRIGLQTYEEGKWTINQILQHFMDWERIWCFRAIIFARREGTTPEAHDQEVMGWNSNANNRSIESILNELRVVRQSSILMFESFNKEILETTCNFFEYEMSITDIGLTIPAHQIHHLKVIKERYLPLDK